LEQAQAEPFWDRVSRWRRTRQAQTALTLGLAVLGPVLALATFLAIGPFDQGPMSPGLRLIVLADLAYVLAVAALVLQRVARLVADRRAQSAGARLHMRLSGVFAAIALLPTVIVAVFATLMLNFGLEGWFSARVSRVVGSSVAAAQAYEQEKRDDLIADAEALARFIEGLSREWLMSGQMPARNDAQLRQILTEGQGLVQRGLREAYVIDGAGELRGRGDRSYLFDFEPPGAAAIGRALTGETVVIDDWANNEFRALTALPGWPDRLLYVSREVDGSILQLVDETQATGRLYRQLEAERGRLLFEFGLLYLGFALILILAATWAGLWFAERLARPVGRLASAAERVGAGDLDIQVQVAQTDDEIATLGQVFNQMTRRLKAQRDELVDSHRQTDRRRRLFDSVLSSVTAGVIGLDAAGRVDFMNRSARRLLLLERGAEGVPLAGAVPEFAALFDGLRQGRRGTAQAEVKLTRGGRMENLLVRIATRRAEGGLEGYVVAFDDVTDLVAAQRMAAWGDVARRIAHEIKNPLTPIQLSAERLRRRFRAMADQGDEPLEQYTDVIIRQTGDLRRIVDEFSRFARMPAPQPRSDDLARILRDAVLLQRVGLPGVTVSLDAPEGPVMAEVDATMISQALTNLIKNAGEALETYRSEKGDLSDPQIQVSLRVHDGVAEIAIADNGVGLPEDRNRLFEPYVTRRESGTGLGLPIVKKIVEDHGGTLDLTDAPVFPGQDHAGALARILLPLARPADRQDDARGGDSDDDRRHTDRR
jgi:two-component system, NtrC family, nitrogen regulation sensor histidine kinase NtrY